MAGLIEKKLSKLPIGSHVEVTLQDEGKEIRRIDGYITDSDYTGSLELTPENGEALLLDFSLVRSLVVKADNSSKEANHKIHPVQEDATDDQEKNKKIVSPVKIASPVMDKPKMLMSDQEILICPKISVFELKELYDSLPKEDRKKLSSAYESYRYGIKTNDLAKRDSAARNAKRTLLLEEEAGYQWHPDAF